MAERTKTRNIVALKSGGAILQLHRNMGQKAYKIALDVFRAMKAIAQRTRVYFEEEQHGHLTSNELMELLKSSKDEVTVIDCREPEDYVKGHIPGAINVPYFEFLDTVDKIPRKPKTVAVCYYSYYSPAPAQAMAKRKFPAAYSMKGGMYSWEQLKLPLEDGPGMGLKAEEEKRQLVGNTADVASELDLSNLPIYMDNNATTPIDPRVLQKMLPFLRESFGNAASKSHAYGWKAAKAVRAARQQISNLIGADSSEIVITSGATECNNLAIKGVAEIYSGQAKHFITCATEHKAVLDTCKHLENQGFKVTYLPVKADGLIDLETLESAFTKDTVLVSIMGVNNEIGVIQPLEEIAKICAEKGAIFHSDATQAVGKITIDVHRQGIDLLSMSAHKIYGPKGVGALYVHKKLHASLVPQIHGGGHENGMRSGTLNVPAVVGLGMACELMAKEGKEENVRIGRLRDRLEKVLLKGLDQIVVNGNVEHRVSGNLHVGIAGVEAESIMMEMKGVAISSGSACTSASQGPSHVVEALGIGEKYKRCTLRFGIGRFNSEAEIDAVAKQVIAEVKRQRRSNRKDR